MKKKKSGSRRIRSIIAVVVIAVISAGVIYFYNQQRMSEENNFQWITSGPFAINKDKYKIGENVFMVVTGLKPNDVGKIVVLDSKGGTFATVQFNGTMKSDFNYFFKPNTERIEKLCKPQDLIGNWTIVFQGTPYRPIPFQVINDWIPGSQAEIKPIDPC